MLDVQILNFLIAHLQLHTKKVRARPIENRLGFVVAVVDGRIVLQNAKAIETVQGLIIVLAFGIVGLRLVEPCFAQTAGPFLFHVNYLHAFYPRSPLGHPW